MVATIFALSLISLSSVCIRTDAFSLSGTNVHRQTIASQLSASITYDDLTPATPPKLFYLEDDEEEYVEEDDVESEEDLTPRLPVRRYRPKKSPVIAIIGRPNVGKSALVNRIAGTQSGGAIVADETGITRDRTYRPAEFLGEKFQVVDTGGLVFDEDTVFASEIREQAMLAMEEASGVIFVTDGMVGCTTLDLQVAEFLRKEICGKIPVMVAVNKCESEKTGMVNAADFWQLGLGEPLAVSAIHGTGVAELLENMYETMVDRKSAIPGFGTKAKILASAKVALKNPPEDEDPMETFIRKYGIGDEKDRLTQQYEEALSAFDDENAPEEVGVAIIGRPNVGKSSLLNSIFGETRAIVSDRAGTTRDSIDAVMERPSSDADKPSTIYRFVDTAGIRRKGKIDFGPEFFMVNRALRAVRRADVVLLILDALEGVTEQDRLLAHTIASSGRAVVIICNKWDAVIKDSATYDKSVRYVREELPSIRWAPILFISAETGQRVGKIYDMIDSAVSAHRKRITTSVWNEVLRDAILWQPPPAKRSGQAAKIYYVSQASTRPPTLVVHCNDPKLISDNYKRYLDRKFRESIEGFEATPIRWIFRGRRVRDVMRNRKMNGDPGDGGSGTSYPYPYAD